MLRRPDIKSTRIGCINQGTIFNCATSNTYEEVEVFGLVITARCDLAQDKYRILNYIPIVKLSDWMGIDGANIIINSERSDIRGRIKAELKSLSIPDEILKVVPIESVYAARIAENNGLPLSKRDNEKFERINKNISTLNEIDNIYKLKPINILKYIHDNHNKKVKELVSRLIKHEVAGFYLLERIFPDEAPDGYVCILNEVSTLSRLVAERLRNGLPKEQWIAEVPANHRYGLSFHYDDFAMPISEVGSPTIEHIMQSFSNIFVRIGVEDPHADDVECLQRKLEISIGKVKP